MMAGTAALRFSTCVISRASARRSPRSMRSTSAAGSDFRGVGSDPAIEVERPDSNTGRVGGRPPRAGLLLDLGTAEGRVTGPARAPVDVGEGGLGRLRVAALRRRLQLLGPRLQRLRVALELRPFLPDLGLGARDARIHRVLGKELRDP